MSNEFVILIRQYRCKFGFSYSELAEDINLDPAYVSRILARLEQPEGEIILHPGLVSRLLAGEHLTGPQARKYGVIEHIINIVRWLHNRRYTSRAQAIALLEAAGMPQLRRNDPEEADLIRQLDNEFPPSAVLKSRLHPFGDLLCEYLSRKPGLSPKSLGEKCIDGGSRVVYDMMKGKRFTAPKARKRIIGVIDCLCNPWRMGLPEKQCLIDLAEANALLEAACMPRLRRAAPEEMKLLDQLIPSTIRYRRNKLIQGKDADASTKLLGDIALEYEKEEAVHTLWTAIQNADDKLPRIVDHCAYTTGRIVLETTSPDFVEICFDIFEKSTDRKSVLVMDRFFAYILDKFAYTVGRVIRETENDEIRQRFCRFVDSKATGDDPVVRDKYDYVRKEVLRYCD